jgi:hypothetical protein
MKSDDMRILPISLLLVAFGQNVWAETNQPAREKIATAVDKTETAVKHAAEKTGTALKKAAVKTEQGVKKAAVKTGEALDKTGKKIEDALR